MTREESGSAIRRSTGVAALDFDRRGNLRYRAYHRMSIARIQVCATEGIQLEQPKSVRRLADVHDEDRFGFRERRRDLRCEGPRRPGWVIGYRDALGSGVFAAGDELPFTHHVTPLSSDRAHGSHHDRQGSVVIVEAVIQCAQRETAAAHDAPAERLEGTVRPDEERLRRSDG